MDWHDNTCRRLDQVSIGGLITCLSCGSCNKLDTQQTTEPNFEYPPIDQHAEIRLIWLQPGEFDEPIRCDLLTTGICKKSYEAISYTWAGKSSDYSKTSTIFLDAKPFPVTRNCEMALKRVRARYRHTKKCIWIDSVCIDQDNLDEKGCQVRLMGRIFSQAKAVLVYAGEFSEEASSALDILRLTSQEF